MLSPDPSDPQPLLLHGSKMSSPAGKGYISPDLVQKAPQNAADGSCAEDEIGRALDLIHWGSICANDLRGFRR